VFAPTMSERNTREEEDPMYRWATGRGLVKEPVLFADGAGRWRGSDSFDAYAFWPRVQLVEG
jgi:hypothetical protein